MVGDDLSWVDEPTVLMVPRFCPRCARAGAADETKCTACGQELVAQGYCPVCEDYVHRPAGTDCPKHEIPLEERAPVPELPAQPQAVRWVTVATYADGLQSDAPRLRLEAEGIPTFLEGERMGRNTIYQVATGGVKLQVPAEHVADARVLLSQVWEAPKDADDLDDAWDDLAPAPWEKRRQVMKGVIVLILLGPVVLALVGALLASLFVGR